MNQNAFAVFFTLIVLAPCSLTYGAIEVLDGGVIFQLSSNFKHNSSIDGNSDGEEDVILTLDPSLRFSREKGIISSEMILGTRFQRYKQTGDENDSDNFYGSLLFKGFEQKGNPLNFLASVGYERITEPDQSLGVLADTDVYDANADIDYQLSNTFVVSNLLKVTIKEEELERIADSVVTTNTFKIHYLYSEKLEFNSSYTFVADRQSGSSTNSKQSSSNSHTLFLEASGDLLPKVSGTVAFGGSYRRFLDSDNQDNSLDPYVNIDLTWNIQERTSVDLLIAHSLKTSNEVTATQTINVGVSHQLAEKFETRLELRYDHSSFDGANSHTDDTYLIESALEYTMNKHLFVDFGLSFEQNDSTDSFLNYNRTVAFASIRWTY